MDASLDSPELIYVRAVERSRISALMPSLICESGEGTEVLPGLWVTTN